MRLQTISRTMLIVVVSVSSILVLFLLLLHLSYTDDTDPYMAPIETPIVQTETVTTEATRPFASLEKLVGESVRLPVIVDKGSRSAYLVIHNNKVLSFKIPSLSYLQPVSEHLIVLSVLNEPLDFNPNCYTYRIDTPYSKHARHDNDPVTYYEQRGNKIERGMINGNEVTIIHDIQNEDEIVEIVFDNLEGQHGKFSVEVFSPIGRAGRQSTDDSCSRMSRDDVFETFYEMLESFEFIGDWQ